MAYGGRVFNQVAPNALPDKTSKPNLEVEKTLQPIPREMANLEAEKDEYAWVGDSGGLPAIFSIGGKPHSDGGTPLNLPDNSFIYSKTKSMKIKDPKVLSYFGVTKPMTPAQIVQKTAGNFNDFRKVLADPDSDELQRKTAEMNIQNANEKLAMLAIYQESTKGFPQGIPDVAQTFLLKNMIPAQDFFPKVSPEMDAMINQMIAQKEQNQQQQAPMEQQMPQGKYGIQLKRFQNNPFGNQLISGQKLTPTIQNPTYVPNTENGQPNYVNAPVKLQTNDNGSLAGSGVLQPGLAMDENNQTVNLSNVNNTITGQANPQTPGFAAQAWDKTKGIIGKAKPYVAAGLKTLRTLNDTIGFEKKPEINAAEQFASLTPQVGTGAGTLLTGMEPVNLSAGYYGINRANQYGRYAKKGGQLKKVKITALPKAQNGIQTKKDAFEYNPEFMNEYVNIQGYEKDTPSINWKDPKERERLSTQELRGENIYGDLDWSSDELYSDFKRRHAWYIKDNPNFDPHNNEEVKKFQRAYCARVQAAGMKNCWFTDSEKDGTGKDGKFGEHTWIAPGLNPISKPTGDTPLKGEEPVDDSIPFLNPANVDVPVRRNTKFDFLPQDKLGLLGSLIGAGGISSPDVYNLPITGYTFDPSFISPNYRVPQESYNIAMQTAAAYGTPQGLAAFSGSASGNTLDAAAKIDHNTALANADIYNKYGVNNQAQALEIEKYNKMNAQQTLDAQSAYKVTKKAKKHQALENIFGVMRSAYDNAANLYNTNQVYGDVYQIDPSSGLINFVNPKMMRANKKASTSALAQLKTELDDLNIPEEDQIEILKAAATGKYKPPQQNDFLPDYTQFAGPMSMGI